MVLRDKEGSTKLAELQLGWLRNTEDNKQLCGRQAFGTPDVTNSVGCVELTPSVKSGDKEPRLWIRSPFPPDGRLSAESSATRHSLTDGRE
ncbi:hypothetical protein GN956_G15154 [Arapaima gigas]